MSRSSAQGRKLSVRRFLGLIVLLFAMVVGVLAGMAGLGMKAVSGVRAYVAGEGLWSKAQKNAAFSLARYVISADPSEWNRFRSSLEIEEGDERARRELEKTEPDFEKTRSGFLAGRNHPDDIPDVIWLFRTFRWLERVDHVIAVWTEGDVARARLKALGEEIHREVERGSLSDERRRSFLARIAEENDRLSVLEDSFSGSLGETARTLQRTVFLLICVISALLLVIATWTARHFAGVLEREEEASRRSETEYREIVDFSPIGIYRSSLEGRILTANRALSRMLGYGAPEELVGLDMANDISFDHSSRACRLEGDDEALENAQAPELLFRTKSGAPIWVQVDCRRVVDHGYCEGFVHDISARRRTDLTLRENEERYRVLFDANPLALWVFDPLSRRIFAANAAAIDLFGYSREELLGKTIREFLHPEEMKRLENLVVPLGSGRRSSGIWKHRRKDGSTLDVDVHTDDIVLGGIQLRFALLIDVSEKARLEEQIRQAQKMEAVGRLAGGVAHDFNNLLTVILGYGNLALQSLAADAPEREAFEQIVEAGERAATLTQQLLALSRKQVLAPHVLDLNSVVSEMDKMLDRVIGEDVELVSILAADLGRALADPGQMQQIILNLAVNARDAMPLGGKLTIETANHEVDEAEERMYPETRRGHCVTLSVSDTGTGMDAQTLSHIFEPFFTTKEIGKGTGLGLAMVDGIVQQSGGSIRVSSVPGEGTTFLILLPRIETDEESPPPRTSPDKLMTDGRQTVLLVEDETAVRRLAREILEQGGYEVLEALDGGIAQILATTHPGPIHLLLTDVVMPGVSGPDLATRVRTARPEIQVIFMSGYSDEAIARHGFAEEGADFFLKPFTPASLLRMVREVLARR